jgi:hypothetical protein
MPFLSDVLSSRGPCRMQIGPLRQANQLRTSNGGARRAAVLLTLFVLGAASTVGLLSGFAEPDDLSPVPQPQMLEPAHDAPWGRNELHPIVASAPLSEGQREALQPSGPARLRLSRPVLMHGSIRGAAVLHLPV